MNADDLFNAGATAGIVPEGDAARQAVDSLRGYAFQALAAALAWVDIDEKGRLYLEVAEDYAIVAEQALEAVQVRDTEGSGSVTLNSEAIRGAVGAFVDLVERNPDIPIELRYFTTSEIGTEQAVADRPAGMAGLEYWRKVAAGADPSPLRTILESDKFPKSVRDFAKARDDPALRRDLIGRIHWDCGRPDFMTLRQELEERLVVVGRDGFNLPAPEARRLADHLVYRVLRKSIAKAAGERVLTRAELNHTIDAATRISVPRATLEAINLLASGGAASLGEDLGSHLSAAGIGWLIDGATLPLRQGMIDRVAVESAVSDALTSFGTGVLVGGSGLGKSNLSRAVAAARAGAFFMVDLRDINADETRRRIDIIFAHIGGLPSTALILEDLNFLDDTRVVLSLSRVIEACRRRDREVLITCYRNPSIRALADAALDQGCVVECPYFSEEEAHALVRMNGGNPDRWGRLAYVAGAGGHPQLTHAFVIGMAARGWPTEEISSVVVRGLSSDDTDAAGEAARRSLVSALPEGTRNLLYRLSLTIGRFDRSLALIVGELPPPVSRAGECLDQLVGPWIEAVGNDLFRVSPLASAFGREMLPVDAQEQIHNAIAVQMRNKRTIDASDADVFVMHAIAGKWPEGLATIAHSVLTADAHTLDVLAEHTLFISFFRTDAPIYPENPLVSGMLRLAQFKLAAAANEGNKASQIAAALINEISDLPEGQEKRVLESVALGTVLITMGVANFLDDWIALLHRYKVMIEEDDYLQSLVSNVESAVDPAGSTFFGMLFGIGSANLDSVTRLEHVINELDELDASERTLWLTPIDRSFSDYSTFINGPWAAQQRHQDFDAADAAMRYQRMAEKTQNWGIRPLSLQCSVARAVMLNEYQNHKEGALAVLEEANAALGDDLILARARAKVYWHHGEHQTALEILRGIADQIGADNPVERAFALREAAISAAKTGEWSQAELWFLDAQSAASLAEVEDMQVMAIGLGADSAVAALETGNVDRTLLRLAEAIDALASVNPDDTLRAAYCHRVIRHTVLWAQSRVEESDIKVDGEPIAMEPGTCSNPDPLSAVRELPLGHIDIAWYMLAEIEIAVGVDVGIVAKLGDRLAQGSIPMMDSHLRLRTIQADVDRLDADGFALHFTSYLESAVYLLKEARQRRTTIDPLAPERGEVPTLDKNTLFGPEAAKMASDAILAFGIRSALAHQREAMSELEAALESRYGGPFPGKQVVDHWKGKPVSLEELDQIVVTIINMLLQNEYVEPFEFWTAGLRFFERINQSNFSPLLTSRLAAWQRSGWQRITTEESFRLYRPLQTVPAIEAVLMMPTDDRRFVATLLLTASEAIGSSLGSALRDSLKAMAEEAGPVPNAV